MDVSGFTLCQQMAWKSWGQGRSSPAGSNSPQDVGYVLRLYAGPVLAQLSAPPQSCAEEVTLQGAGPAHLVRSQICWSQQMRLVLHGQRSQPHGIHSTVPARATIAVHTQSGIVTQQQWQLQIPWPDGNRRQWQDRLLAAARLGNQAQRGTIQRRQMAARTLVSEAHSRPWRPTPRHRTATL